MRGEVEIWRGDELLLREPNMLMDGAGELLADIMTVSRSLSGIEDHATSSILDSSNYTIQAISFGTGPDAFQKNAHHLNASKETLLVDTFYPVFLNGAVPIPSINTTFTSDLSSFYPEVGLPSAPNPTFTQLDLSTNVSAAIVGNEVSSVFPGNGQLTNFMPSAIMSSMCEDTIFSSTLSGYVAGSVMGAFSEGSSSPFSQNTKNFLYDGAAAAFTAPNRAGGFFNEVSSMDVSGFVTMVMSSVPHAGYDASSPASGLTVSANSTFASNGIVEYYVSIAAADVAMANSYGGIYALGLWTIDMEESLLNGNTPPFAFSVLNNPRKYRLFSRKGLTKNLCYIEDDGTNPGDANYSDLIIRWRIDFL